MFIEPNISITETVDLIKEKIKSKTPFALTRFGDGEIRMIRKEKWNDEAYQRICNLWNYNYPSEVDQAWSDISNLLLNTLFNSDVVGFLDKNTPYLPHGIYDPYRWSISNNFMKENGIDPNSLMVCDHQISRSKELGNLYSFKKILDGNDLHIISPNKSVLSKKNLSLILECNVEITLHENSKKLVNRNDYFRKFDKIKEDVVVFGTALEKDHGIYLRDHFGKIAIDLGSTLDAWGGLITREWFNNIQKHLIL